MRTPLPGGRPRTAAAALLAAVTLPAALLSTACGSAARATGPGGPPDPAVTAPTAAPATSTTPTSATAAATPTTAPTTAAGRTGGRTAPGDPTAPSAGSWTTYQDGATHLGVAAGAGPAPLDGSALYGQPLVYGGQVIVATEADDLYGLDATTGAVRWEVNLGAPLRHVGANAGCGDIDPLGVTSTPVVAAASGTVYAVGETSRGGAPPVHFTMVAVRVATGHVEWQGPVDPPLPAGEDPVHLLQRAALALRSGRVYVAFGGQYGDCGTYHGWVVSVPTDQAGVTTDPAGRTAFDVTPSGTGGAIWNSGSGPAVGPDGSVYLTTGNPNGGGPAPWAESVLKLSPALATPPEAVFEDRAAYADLDLATAGPVLLPDGTVFAAGKTDIAYLLSGSSLQRVAPVSGQVCGSDPDGGAAFDAALDSLYLPCQDGGVQQVRLAARSTGWHSSGANSTVVLAGRSLWSLDYRSPAVQELDPATGRTLYRLAIGASLPHFASLSIAGGLVLVQTRSGVTALRGA